MITWISKGSAAALVMLALTGCEAGLTSGGGGATSPLSRATMVKGVTLVAPAGFCIDRSSLKTRFAVMARCDGLGAAQAAGTAPRGLITVSLTDKGSNALPTAVQVATAAQLQNIEQVDEQPGHTIFRAQGRTPTDGLAPTQWRGAAAIGDQTAGIAVYGPENGEILTLTGRNILLQLIDRSVGVTP